MRSAWGGQVLEAHVVGTAVQGQAGLTRHWA
jgi:hypothetical protein